MASAIAAQLRPNTPDPAAPTAAGHRVPREGRHPDAGDGPTGATSSGDGCPRERVRGRGLDENQCTADQRQALASVRTRDDESGNVVETCRINPTRVQPPTLTPQLDRIVTIVVSLGRGCEVPIPPYESCKVTATLVKGMEDHMHELAVILAGYPGEIEEMLSSNRGLLSRIQSQIEFPDYSPSQLFSILELLISNVGVHLTQESESLLRQILTELCALSDAHFGNA